ncbi:hypothetical protein NQ314_003655 [Rhamnusium bicolor]|uniref:ABC transporter domain-containing protein n=1 Tax=Rhamnusium bicolor TaxID=1586634 RepID=A0AAV8ZLP3_9CUCU|nr:hypothetical protein NQ314_003655 [Rhamnusium bicolor]
MLLFLIDFKLLFFFQLLLNLVGAIIVVGFIEPYLLIPTFLMVTVFYFIRKVYLQTSRNVKRLEGITRSPVFAHLNATLQGLPTIRCYYGSAVGLGITQCIGLSGLIQWGMRQSAELENQMTSVERVLEFTRIEHEPDLESVKLLKLEKFIAINLNLVIEPKEKVGIVGRTGAGKSSLIATLFRLAYYEGQILIDNLDISVLGLHDLRRKISIIPQEPVLFSGTLRYNLDPFNEHNDEAMLAALFDVETKSAMTYGMACLDHMMSEGGINLSVGQRQMVCLARAILRNNIILVMDEATANVDAQTDKFIQSTIRTKFANCTVLTIAHRLHTVMDSDRVLVMDAGVAVEFDIPHLLLQNRNSYLSEMVKRTGPGMAETLKRVARESYEVREKRI